MRATVFLGAAVAGTLGLVASHDTTAQAPQQSTSKSPTTLVQLTVPPSGLAFNFNDLDRNADRSISVEEWNAFVASLQSRPPAKMRAARPRARRPRCGSRSLVGNSIRTLMRS